MRSCQRVVRESRTAEQLSVPFTLTTLTTPSTPGPFIWADDDEVPVHGGAVTATVSEPVLLLAPYSSLGLTPAHLEQARAFCSGLPRMEGA